MNKAQKFWDQQANRFDDNERQFESETRELIARTREFLNVNDIVLDFGCATGSKTIELADSVKHIHGLDFSAEMISEALKKKNNLNITNVSFSKGTIFNDDLEKASFDKIIAYSIIHLLDESEKVIQRIYDLLKPGGFLIAETACFKEKMEFKTRLQVITYRLMERLAISPLHINMYKTSDVEHLMNRQGFKIVKSEKTFYNGMTISFIVAVKN
jgi:ubiquinone/menaquinone biosynthesis C-methylase UbiE